MSVTAVGSTRFELPLLHAAFGEGRLSYSKVRALTRVATADREEELLNVALSSTAAQVEHLVRSISHIDRRDDESATGKISSTARCTGRTTGRCR